MSSEISLKNMIQSSFAHFCSCKIKICAYKQVQNILCLYLAICFNKSSKAQEEFIGEQHAQMIEVINEH